jgi:CheY-like chemotaxis protein
MITEADILNANLLVVDDQESNVILLEQILHQADYNRVTSTMDSLTVVELYRNNCYDLILLDLQMPEMDGFEVMEGLKDIETGGYLPVLVITAQPGHKLRALQAGAKDFVSKPFDVLEVTTRIHNMLEVRLLYKEVANYSRMLEQTVEMRTAELHESEARFRALRDVAGFCAQNRKRRNASTTAE